MRPSLCVHESPELQESRFGVKQGCNYFHYFPSPTKDLEEQLEEEEAARQKLQLEKVTAESCFNIHSFFISLSYSYYSFQSLRKLITDKLL